MSSAARRLRTLAGTLALVVGGLAAGLSLIEVADRLALLPCVVKWPGVWELHPQFGWFHRPKIAGWGQMCRGTKVLEWRRTVRINAQGLHDRERTYEKPAGTFRILVLGDSFVEAAQVEIAESMTGRLEATLGAQTALPRRYEVVNAGVSSWSTDNELLYFRHEGVRFAPDLVLLMLNPGNDIGEIDPRLGPESGARMAKPWFTLENRTPVLHGFPVYVPPPATGWHARAADMLFRRTHVYPLATWMLARTQQRWEARATGSPAPAAAAAPPAAAPGAAAAPRKPPPPIAFMVDTLAPEWATAWELVQQLVRLLRTEVEATGALFALAVVPSKFAVGGPVGNWLPDSRGFDVDRARPEARAQAFVDAEGIPSCPLLPALRAHLADTGSNGYFVWDVHWAADGHAVVAETLARCLAQHGLLAPASGA